MPTTQTQIRRDTATNINAATPTAGELAWDTTNERLRVGNGSTAGGIYQASAKDVQNNAFGYATAGGSANALTLTLSPAPASYSAGQEFVFKAASSNSGAATLNVNSLGAKNIYKMSAGVLGAVASGDIISGTVYKVIYDGTQFQLLSAASSGIVRVNEQIFTASGTYTPSSGMVYCIAEVLGGGGGGGSANNNNMGGGGGGAGAYSKRWLSASDIGASKAVTIGAGGTGGASSDGVDGGTSSLGTLLNCTGGAGGKRSTATSTFAGGAGGTATNGDINISGNTGLPSVASAFGGGGANTMYGAGGIYTTTAGVGASGSGYGSGGAGGYGANGGGAGAGGIVIITEFCTV